MNLIIIRPILLILIFFISNTYAFEYSLEKVALYDGSLFENFSSLKKDKRYSNIDQKTYENYRIATAYGIEEYDEKIYITDCPSNTVKVFDLNLKFLYNLEDYFLISEFDTPSGITFDDKNNVYILEEKKNRIFVGNLKTKTFSYITEFKNLSRVEKINNPLSIYYKDGLFFLANSHNNNIIIFNDDGFIRLDGYYIQKNKINKKSFSFDEPYYLAFNDNSLFVNDSGNNIIVNLEIDYEKIKDDLKNNNEPINLELINYIGKGPEKLKDIFNKSIFFEGLDAPNDIRYKNNLLFVAEYNKNRIIVFSKLGKSDYKLVNQINHMAVKIFNTLKNNKILAWGHEYKEGYGGLKLYRTTLE